MYNYSNLSDFEFEILCKDIMQKKLGIKLSITELEKEVFGMQNMKSSDKFFGQVVQFFRDAKRKMSMAVNMAMVYSYYESGRLIIDEKQNGNERAAYGKYILQELFRQLTEEWGRGFTFVGWQVRFTFEEEHYRVELVFFNRLLKCFVWFKGWSVETSGYRADADVCQLLR